MKKLLAVTAITLFTVTACTESSTKETTNQTETNNATESKEVKSSDRAVDIKDSTKMLDKKLADPNSTYTPDSLK